MSTMLAFMIGFVLCDILYRERKRPRTEHRPRLLAVRSTATTGCVECSPIPCVCSVAPPQPFEPPDLRHVKTELSAMRAELRVLRGGRDGTAE